MNFLFATLVLLFSSFALAQTPEDKLSPNRIIVTDEMEDFVVNPGGPQRVSKEKIELYKYTDVNRALRQTSGVYIREEDGQGLRPNIGLRGTNPDRSKKVVLMEDGVLIGPAPYAAPAAYYTPFMNHVESLDVYKGFAAVPYGPNSIGGAVNYVSLGIPNKFTPKIEVSTGSYNTINAKASIGGQTAGGIGYLIQANRMTTDGFKKLDGGGNTGFIKNDILGKLRVKLPSAEGITQHLEMRLGYTHEDSHESYLGLSLADLNASPYRRYASSQLDEMKWDHTLAQFEHNIQFAANSQVKTTIYRQDFHRDWYRLDRFKGGTASLFDILNDPTANASSYNILTGQDDSSTGLGSNGNLIVMNNDRTFYNQGIQSRWNGFYNWGETRHDLEVSLRFHQDQILRNHGSDTYAMTGGRMIRTADPRGADAINRNHADALTLGLLENATWGKWVFTALGRFENVKFTYDDKLTNTRLRRGDSVAAPGAGALYKVTDLFSVRTSVNKGVSIAGLSDTGEEAKEESVNYELGFKYISQDNTRQGELVLFYNDYSNITGTCTSSTGCASANLDQSYNGGKAIIQGIESRVSQNLYWGAVQFPFQLNLTMLKAEFNNSFDSAVAEWGIGRVEKGDPLPYVPKLQYTFTAGTVYKRFTQEFAFVFQRQAFDQSAALNRREIPAYGIIDWTANYKFNDHGQIFFKADNLLSRDYVVGLRPYGARPGKPQSFMVGLSYNF